LLLLLALDVLRLVEVLKVLHQELFRLFGAKVQVKDSLRRVWGHKTVP